MRAVLGRTRAPSWGLMTHCSQTHLEAAGPTTLLHLRITVIKKSKLLSQKKPMIHWTMEYAQDTMWDWEMSTSSEENETVPLHYMYLDCAKHAGTPLERPGYIDRRNTVIMALNACVNFQSYLG